MKKILSLILALTLLCTVSAGAFAACDVNTKELRFNDDGSFRVMMLTDFQDIDFCSRKSADFLDRVLDYAKPDLVVLGGDQLSDDFKLATPLRVAKALQNILKPMNDRQIPFLFAFGNHDHDRNALMTNAKQAALYYRYDYCFAARDGFGPSTYNKLVYSSDGLRPVFNIYVMDTNNKNTADGGKWDGVHADQVAWYKAKSDELKALNGGQILPSILFQHIPVKEIFEFFTEVPEGTPGALSKPSLGVDGYYVLDPDRMISETWRMGELPGCEILTRSTGQYEAWLEKGDLTLGAFFGHDHVNDFVGVTKDGIRLGYTGGFGFATYGMDDERCVKIFDFDENDVEGYTFHTLRYCDLPDSAPQSFMERLNARLHEFAADIVDLLGTAGAFC